MHKGVMILTKATGKDDARINADQFMDGYGEGRVWDWYVIGGRWSGHLNPINKNYMVEAHKLFSDPTFISTKDVENRKVELQSLWDKMGGKGTNPYNRDHYDIDPAADDILPLSECLEQVKEFVNDVQKDIADEKKRADQYLAEGKEGMAGYLYHKMGQLMMREFCSDCNVYNIEEGDYSIPKDTKDWYVVMIDFHN